MEAVTRQMGVGSASHCNKANCKAWSAAAISWFRNAAIPNSRKRLTFTRLVVERSPWFRSTSGSEKSNGVKTRAKSKYVVSWVRKVPITSIFFDECAATMLAHVSCIWYLYAVTRIWSKDFALR